MGKSMSQYWRTSHSTSKVQEQVEVLRSIKRLVRQHNPEIENVQFSTETDSGRTEQYLGEGKPSIKINPDKVTGSATYPIKDEDMDVLSGLTLHELAHIQAGSFEVKRDINGGDKLTDALVNAGEEIVADNFYSGKQGEYIERARKEYAVYSENPELSGHPLTDALNAYISLAIYKQPVNGLSKEAQDMLLEILSAFSGIKNQEPRDRVRTYINLRERLFGQLKQQAEKERISKGRNQRPTSRQGWARRESNLVKSAREMVEKQVPEDFGNKVDGNLQEKRDGSGMSEEDMQKINELLAQESQDVSELVRGMIDKAYHTHIRFRTYARNYPGKEYRDVDERLVRELLWLKNIKTQRDTVIKRQLDRGKIDKRRLWKTPLDGRVFREKKMKHSAKRAIWLLMDGSGSMNSNSELFKMCASCHKVLQDSRIYQYYLGTAIEKDDTGNMIYRLDDKYGMRKLHPDGTTPSGSALLYTAHLLNQQGGGILLHFSDSGANGGIPVQEALRSIAEKCPKVKVVNVLENELVDSYREGAKGHEDRILNLVLYNNQDFAEILKRQVQSLWNIKG